VPLADVVLVRKTSAGAFYETSARSDKEGRFTALVSLRRLPGDRPAPAPQPGLRAAAVHRAGGRGPLSRAARRARRAPRRHRRRRDRPPRARQGDSGCAHQRRRARGSARLPLRPPPRRSVPADQPRPRRSALRRGHAARHRRPRRGAGATRSLPRHRLRAGPQYALDQQELELVAGQLTPRRGGGAARAAGAGRVAADLQRARERLRRRRRLAADRARLVRRRGDRLSSR